MSDEKNETASAPEVETQVQSPMTPEVTAMAKRLKLKLDEGAKVDPDKGVYMPAAYPVGPRIIRQDR